MAREAARAAASATTPTQAIRTGHQRGQGRRRLPTQSRRLHITVDPAGPSPRGTLTVTASYQVPLDDLPTLGLLPGQLTLAARQQEPIDPHKSR